MTASLATAAVGLLTGVVAGLAYFSALWLTIRAVATGRWRVGWLLVSFVVRLAMLLAFAALLLRWSMTAFAWAGVAFFIVRIVALACSRRMAEVA